jgi:hypothetical protein
VSIKGPTRKCCVSQGSAEPWRRSPTRLVRPSEPPPLRHALCSCKRPSAGIIGSGNKAMLCWCHDAQLAAWPWHRPPLVAGWYSVAHVSADISRQALTGAEPGAPNPTAPETLHYSMRFHSTVKPMPPIRHPLPTTRSARDKAPSQEVPSHALSP